MQEFFFDFDSLRIFPRKLGDLVIREIKLYLLIIVVVRVDGVQNGFELLYDIIFYNNFELF